MTSPCDITPTQHEVITKGTLRFELWVAKELCVVPDGQTTNLSPAAVSIRITNTGAVPVQLIAADPDALFVRRIWDANRPNSSIDLNQGPEPEDLPSVQVELAPDQAWQSAPVEHYMSILAPDILRQTHIDGTPLSSQHHLRRDFGLEVQFSANVNTGKGFVPTQHLLKGAIQSVLVNKDQ